MGSGVAAGALVHASGSVGAGLATLAGASALISGLLWRVSLEADERARIKGFLAGARA
jgi:hypothetical protein